MAAILKLRRGVSNASPTLDEGELYLHNGIGSIQFGSGSTTHTLLPLNTPIVGNINLTGNISASSLTLTGNLTVAQNITFGGTLITFGDANTDNVVITADLSSSIIPNDNNAFDLGASDKNWRRIYGSEITGSLSGSINNIDITDFSQSVDARLIYLETDFSESVDGRINTLNLYTSSQDTKNATLGNYTGSIDTKFSTLGNYTASINSFTSSEETKNTTLGEYTASINSYTTSLDTKNNTLGNYTTSLDTKNNTLGTYTGSIDTKFSTLGEYTTSINSFTSSEETKNTTLASYTGSVNIAISSLNSYTASLKNVLELTGSNMIVIGDLSVRGTTTTINSTTIQLGDNIIELNGSGVTDAGFHVKDATGISLQTGSLIWNSTNDYWKAGALGSESRILLAEGDGIVSSSTQVADVLISLNSYTSSQDTKNSTLGNYTSSLNLYTASLDTKNNTLGDYTASLNTFTASEETKNTTLGIYTASLDNSISLLNSHTSSQDTKNSTLGTYTASLEVYTQSLETKNSTLASYTGSVNNDLARFELVSGSYKTLIGQYIISSSLGSAAFYNVSSSIASGDPTTLGNAFAIKEYVDATLIAVGAGDITGVFSGNGLSGGADSGSVTLTLDTGSTHFTNGVKTKLDVEGVISGSSQLTASYDSRYSLSGSVFEPFSESVDTRLVLLETASNENPLTFNSTTTIELIRLADTITANAIGGVVSGSSQIIDILTPLNNFSSSEETKNTTLGTYTGSNDTKWNTLGGQSGSWITESETGSFARTNVANIFTQTQTITGSMYISGDLLVQGSSSLQNITASAVSIGTNLINLNTATPAVRYAGMSIVDSGSSGVSASLLWDSLTDDFIFTHRSSGSPTLDSSMFMFGPLNTGSLDNIVGVLPNRLTKGENNGAGHDHHITSSQISDDGTTVSIPGNLNVTGSITGNINSTNGVVSGSSQITLSSTTGGGTSANVQFNSLGIGMTASATAGRIDATNDIVAYSSSDIRFKENIQPIQNALAKINQIGGYEFDWNAENKNEHGYEGHDLGVIAQEIEAIAPELVQTRENGYKAVKYDKLVSVLIQAIKELSQKINDLENK